MKTEIIKIKGDWQEVVDDCRATVAKPPLGREPSSEWKTAILIAEHEPIRDIWIKWKWRGIKYWIAMHWKTHIWPSRVNTQRTDRTGIDREKKYQDAPVDFTGDANCQHLIDTSRKRLCYMAAPETREYAEDLKRMLKPVQPETSDVMVPNCVYRCGCPEMNGGCGWWSNFVHWCWQRSIDVAKLPINERYAMYNAWFYRIGGESDEAHPTDAGAAHP